MDMEEPQATASITLNLQTLPMFIRPMQLVKEPRRTHPLKLKFEP
jgi:hypothetical protein